MQAQRVSRSFAFLQRVSEPLDSRSAKRESVDEQLKARWPAVETSTPLTHTPPRRADHPLSARHLVSHAISYLMPSRIARWRSDCVFQFLVSIVGLLALLLFSAFELVSLLPLSLTIAYVFVAVGCITLDQVRSSFKSATGLFIKAFCSPHRPRDPSARRGVPSATV